MSPRDPLPPRDEAVRRLLADARHDEPTPRAVVDRLDAVLAELAAGREPAGPSSTPSAAPPPPDRLREHRHRRGGRVRPGRRRAWLAAAAVVAAVGLGGTVLQQGGGDLLTGASPGSESAGDAAVEGGAEESAPPPPTASTDRGGRPSTAPGDALPSLGRTRLLPQVRRLLGSPGAGAPAQDRAEACGARVGPGDRTLPVSYAGRLAVLVVRAEDEAGTVVDLVVCGRSGIARSLLVAP